VTKYKSFSSLTPGCTFASTGCSPPPGSTRCGSLNHCHTLSTWPPRCSPRIEEALKYEQKRLQHWAVLKEGGKGATTFSITIKSRHSA
jgi:hypothetical protein